MKRNFLFILGLFLSVCGFAETETATNIYAQPIKIDKGTTETTLELYLIGKGSYLSIQFYFGIPEGITIGKATAEQEQYSARKALNAVADSYNTYSFIIINLDQILLEVKDEEEIKIVTLKLNIEEGFKEGVYPIYVKKVYANNQLSETKNENYGYSVSYIKIGETNEGFNPVKLNNNTYDITTGFAKALAEDESITSINMSAVANVYGFFPYLAGREITDIDEENTLEAKVLAKKSVSEGKKYASVCLPFDFDPTKGTTKCYTFDNKIENGYAKFSEAKETVKAGTAVIIEGNFEYNSDDKIELKNVTTETKDNVYYVSNDKFYHGSNITFAPLAGAWTFDYDVKGFTLDTATGIKEVSLDEVEGIYDLSGRKLTKATRGVNIVNGKKVLNK